MAVTVKVLKKPKRTLATQVYVPAVASGLAMTLERFIKNTLGPKDKAQTATILYPEERREYPERFRGVHRLTQREDGSPRCVACLCCSTVCPAQCIHIEPAEYEPDDPRYGYERYPEVFVIDELRCIFCGYCEDACPTEAIVLEHEYRLTFSDRRDAIYTKDMLIDQPLPGTPGTPQQTEPGRFTRSIPEMEDPL